MRIFNPEMIGRFCRWLLLGLVACVCLYIVRASFLAITAVASENQTQLIMPDGMFYPPGKNHVLNGMTTPGCKYISTIALWHQAGKDELGALINRGYNKGCYLRIGNILEQRSSLVIKGMPYSAAAFSEIECITEVVPKDDLVFLVKASVALNHTGTQGKQAIRELARQGTLGFFVEVNPEVYISFRDRLHKSYPNIPVILIQDAASWWKRSPKALYEGLDRTDKRRKSSKTMNTRKSIVFITDRPDKQWLGVFSVWDIGLNKHKLILPDAKYITQLTEELRK